MVCRAWPPLAARVGAPCPRGWGALRLGCCAGDAAGRAPDAVTPPLGAAPASPAPPPPPPPPSPPPPPPSPARPHPAQASSAHPVRILQEASVRGVAAARDPRGGGGALLGQDAVVRRAVHLRPAARLRGAGGPARAVLSPHSARAAERAPARAGGARLRLRGRQPGRQLRARRGRAEQAAAAGVRPDQRR